MGKARAPSSKLLLAAAPPAGPAPVAHVDAAGGADDQQRRPGARQPPSAVIDDAGEGFPYRLLGHRGVISGCVPACARWPSAPLAAAVPAPAMTTGAGPALRAPASRSPRCYGPGHARAWGNPCDLPAGTRPG